MLCCRECSQHLTYCFVGRFKEKRSSHFFVLNLLIPSACSTDKENFFLNLKAQLNITLTCTSSDYGHQVRLNCFLSGAPPHLITLSAVVSFFVLQIVVQVSVCLHYTLGCEPSRAKIMFCFHLLESLYHWHLHLEHCSSVFFVSVCTRHMEHTKKIFAE